jgi:parvulin-like peptidyl-prolyl isomerase
MSDSLTTDQEAEAKELEAKIRRVVDQEIISLARLLVSKSDRDLFGQTEFHVRDLLLRAGAKAYEEYLREKKTATKARPSIAQAAIKKQSSRGISR